MSDFMMDLSNYMSVGASNTATEVKHSTNAKAGSDLDMTDFLALMVATFQNQSIDDVASTSEMMNQMVQMSVIQAITNLSTLVTQSSNMSYAASLVGKDVTIGQTVGTKTQAIQGTVTGTGMMNGEQVIFVGSEMYKLSEVMAVGRVPSSDTNIVSVADSTSTARQTSSTTRRLPTRTLRPACCSARSVLLLRSL